MILLGLNVYVTVSSIDTGMSGPATYGL